MADDNNKSDDLVEEASPKEVAEQAEESAKTAEEAAEVAVEARDEVNEIVEEVKEEKIEVPKEKPTKVISKNIEDIISKVEKLTVLELAELVHALEEKFGVTAAAPMAVAASSGVPTEPTEEQTTFNVILASAGANKIGAIKAVRELVPTLGLREAKDLVESAPKPVLEGVNKEKANEAKTKLTAAGATVELQ